MKKALLFLLICCLFAVTSSIVQAGDDLIIYDRHAKIGNRGDTMAAFGLSYSSSGDRFEKDGEKKDRGSDHTWLRVPVWGRYNVLDNLNIFAIVPVESFDNGVDTETGIDDIWLGAKYVVIPQGRLTIRGALDIPTGDDEKGIGKAGGFGIDVAALTEMRIDKFGLFGQAGLRDVVEDNDTKWNPGIAYYVSGRVGYDITRKMPGWVSLTYFTRGDSEKNGAEMPDSEVNWLDVSGGASYKITDEAWIAIPVTYTLAGTNTSAKLTVGVYLGYYFP